MIIFSLVLFFLINLTSWNAVAGEGSWIEYDFKRVIRLSSINMTVNQLPAGQTTHVIMVKFDFYC